MALAPWETEETTDQAPWEGQPTPAAAPIFRPEASGDATAIARAKNAVIAVPQSFALSVGNSISGVARARDTLVEGEGLAMFSPSPNQAKYKSNQRFRAFEAAMLDPSYSQHLIDARSPEETAKIERLLGPPGKLEGLQFKDEQSRIYANNLGLEQQKRLETDPLYQYGQEYNQAAKTVYPTDPALDQKIESKFARAVGGTLPTVALSLIPGVGPALATTQYATGQSESGAVEAIEAGHPELASEAALLNLFTGAASEYALGATSKLKSILASPRLAVYFKRFAAAYPKTLGVTEAVVREIAQEGLEQGMGNVIAADVVGYDPNRPWSQGVMEAGGLGGAAVVPYALLGSFGRRGRGAAPASQSGGNESSAALDRVNEQLAANPIRPADPGTPAAGGGLPAETRAPAVGQFVFQQGGNKIVIEAPTENIAKEYAFRTSPGAVFVRADLPAAAVADLKTAAPGFVAPSREPETGAPVSSPPDAANLPSPPAATGATGQKGQGAGSDILGIISDARDMQARFLKERGTTIEEARNLPKTKQAKLQSDYEAWLKTEGGFRIPPQAGDTTGWKGTQDWRKAVDQVPDIEDKLVERIRDDLPEAKPIIEEIDAIVNEARRRHSQMAEGQTKGLTHELEMLTDAEKARLAELQSIIRPKSQAEAKADVLKKREASKRATPASTGAAAAKPLTPANVPTTAKVTPPAAETVAGIASSSDIALIERSISNLAYRMQQDKARGVTRPENVQRLAELRAQLKSANLPSTPAATGAPGQTTWKIIKTYKGSDGGMYSDYSLGGNPRGGSLTVELNKNGYRIRNIFVGGDNARKGNATRAYEDLNAESLLKTGNPLRSSEIGYGKKSGSTSQSVDATALWDSLVAKGKASKVGDHYEFKPTPAATGATGQKLPGEMVRGDRFKDANGVEFEVWRNRHGTVEAHPVVNGKPVVNKDSGVRFSVTDEAKARNPENRTDLKPTPATPPTPPAATGVTAQKKPVVTPEQAKSASNPKFDFDPKVAKEQKKFLLDAVDQALAAAPDPSEDEIQKLWQASEHFANKQKLEDYNKANPYPDQPQRHTFGYTDAELAKYEAAKQAWEVERAEWQQRKDAELSVVAEPYMKEMIGGADISAALTAGTEAAFYRSLPHVTIEVPGDGVFSIVNTKAAIRDFKERAAKFPTTAARAKAPSSPRVNPTPVPALGEPTKENVLKAASLAVSTDPKRAVLMNVWSDGKETVATDGQRMLIFDLGVGGTEKNPVMLDAKGKPAVVDREYPNWKQVRPAKADLTKIFSGQDAAKLWTVLKQAAAILNKEAVTRKSVRLWLNRDRTLGVSSNEADVGSYEHNVQPEAKLVGGWNPEFLLDALEAARKTGSEKVDVYWTDELSPVVIRGDHVDAVIMPVRLTSLAPSDSSTGASVNSPADPDSAMAAVQAIVNEEAGDVSVTVNHDATLTHDGQVVEGYVHPVTGEIVLNSAAPTMADPANVRRVVREERAHWLLSFTAEGRQALREFIGRITPADRAELQRQGYRRLPGETATDYEARLTNEYIAKQARENTAWWRKLVERVREWLAKNGLAKLSNAEAARAILRRLNAAKAERQLARGYLEVGGGMVLVAPWAKIKDVEMSLAAHHGTPHKLSKFSTKFIGTGEGAQVYGWGLYFAENFAVAQDYAKKLGKEVYLDGQPIFAASNKNYLGKGLGSAAMSALLSEHGDVDKAIAQTKRDYPTDSNTVRQLEKVRGRISFKAQGQIYTVTLDVEPDELLDWDKPLSEQSERVKYAVDGISKIVAKPADAITGRDIYEAAKDFVSKTPSDVPISQRATIALQKRGIKGIRYLDQGSRTKSDQPYWKLIRRSDGLVVVEMTSKANLDKALETWGDDFRAEGPFDPRTYNYVIFDERDITITHENGQPVSAGQLIPNFSLAPVTPVSPETQTQIAVVESQSGNVNERPPAPTLTTAPELRSKLRDMVGSVSGVIHYYGGADLLRAKRGIDLTASYQAAAVKGQTDALLQQLFGRAHAAQPGLKLPVWAKIGFKLPDWMKVGGWEQRVRAFTKRLLHVAARLNATGRNPDGTFRFDDFKVRSGMMTIRAFKDGKHAVGDTFLHIDPKTEITEQFEVGPFVTTPEGRVGYQLLRSMEANTQAELYRTMSESFPELMWLLDMFIDPALASVRKTINGIEIPVFNRFAQAAMMAEADPNFTPLTGYTPDVLVSRSLLGAIRGALSFSQGTRSPGRKYKFGTSRESGYVRDLLTGFNVRTFQMLQEKARREWRNAVLKAAKPIPKGVVPAGWVKLETGMEELWQAAKRLRNWQSPVRYQSASEKLEQMTLDQLRASLDYNENLVWKNDEWMIEYTPFKETQARLADDGSQEYKHFFSEIFALRGKQLMLPQPLIEALLKKYVAVKQHGALYRLAAWGVRNSTQLFLVMPKTYLANVLTNDLFALEAGTRYALRGLMSANANDLRFARNLFTGTFTNRFAAFRQGTGFFAGSDYMTAIRETLPDQIFADSTSLADVKVRWGNSALDYLRQGEIGGAALQIGYGSIDVRAKQRMAFAFLKATAVTNAKRDGLTGNALKAAVDRYLANPPMNDRIQAVEIANFELLNYADSPQVLNDMAQNDFSRLVLPFPRFGYHYITKQLKRLSAAKVLIGKVPKGQRADAFADLVTVGLYGGGGGGILALALASVLGGDDDDDARQRIGTSTVPVVNADGSVTMRPIDREFVTANRMNISAWARASGIESDRADDFWLRVRNYPVVAAAGVTALAYHDAKKYGAATGARQFASGAADLASDFLSVGAAVKVPFKVLAEWQSMGKPMAAQSLVDPFATGVPLSFYITEQLTDSFIPGSRQADELIAWINPTRPRRTASKLLDYSPGVVESLESSHLTGLIMTLARGGESSLPPAGKIDRRTATVPQPSVISAEERWSSLGGFNIKAIPRQEYQRAIQPNK